MIRPSSSIEAAIFAVLVIAMVAGPVFAGHALTEGRRRPARAVVWLVIAVSALASFWWMWRSHS